jgi:hypothetical protein
MAQARGVLQRVLRGRIVFTPRPEGRGYDFEARLDKLFMGIAVERPAWLPAGSAAGREHLGPSPSPLPTLGLCARTTIRPMKRTPEICVGLLLVVGGVGCQFSPNGPSAAKSEPPKPAMERPASTELWERSRQCSEQAEKVVKRVEAVRGPHIAVVASWENHYSVKFQRCYVHITYQNRKAAKSLGIPLFYDELGDAFENRVLATGSSMMIATGRSAAFCSINDGTPNVPGDCDAARAYIDERITSDLPDRSDTHLDPLPSGPANVSLHLPNQISATPAFFWC